MQHVIDHVPQISWWYTGPDSLPQAEFDTDVGTDSDWTVAKMWDPGPLMSSDTFVLYGGLALLDGETYFLQLAVSSPYTWSDWYETSFSMNSVPSIPVPLSPIHDEYTGNLPTLRIQNSTDAEGDTLTYNFSGYHDTGCVAGTAIGLTGVPEGPDSTGGQITDPLGENCKHWWRARAFDGYEYSNWSLHETFLVNGTPEPPTTPQAQCPSDTSGLPVFDMLATFLWSQSFDLDPLDTVYYKLEIAIDSTFTYVNTVDSLQSPSYTLTDSLQFGTRYWWRVTAFDNTGLSTMSPNTPDFWTWTLGDLYHSHSCSVADLTSIVDFLLKGGPPPENGQNRPPGSSHTPAGSYTDNHAQNASETFV